MKMQIPGKNTKIPGVLLNCNVQVYRYNLTYA